MQQRKFYWIGPEAKKWFHVLSCFPCLNDQKYIRGIPKDLFQGAYNLIHMTARRWPEKDLQR